MKFKFQGILHRYVYSITLVTNHTQKREEHPI